MQKVGAIDRFPVVINGVEILLCNVFKKQYGIKTNLSSIFSLVFNFEWQSWRRSISDLYGDNEPCDWVLLWAPIPSWELICVNSPISISMPSSGTCMLGKYSSISILVSGCALMFGAGPLAVTRWTCADTMTFSLLVALYEGNPSVTNGQ